MIKYNSSFVGKKARKPMSISYNKLWKLLIDKGMIKKDLREKAKLSTNVIAKMGKNEDVSTSVLRKICQVLECEIEDIVEIIPDEK
jgi:DNA-binding Xre family transcriptional regulator